LTTVEPEARYHAPDLRQGRHVLKPTRLFAILGIVILVVLLVWWQHHESQLRRQGLSSGHGTSVELPH
jgi:hypothetical protein